ncbi:hypothetical protein [Thermococcus gorgonarius]|uniref:hypothetical protein n=1 Tax=Thermococcus gorgonarius TaxID=71997 RepID=UPI0012FD1864|nr:hypothetical protein [Thermococcus gorgonarius]
MLRIKHPEDVGNVISYAVLVEVSSFIADYSGWIVFYQVGTDFSGMGGFLHNLAESVIEKYQDSLIVEEITVDGEIFEQYLTRNHSDKFPEDLQFQFEKLSRDIIKYQGDITSLERLLSIHRGVFSELLTYYLLSSNRLHRSWEKVDWNVPVGGEQIDVFAIDAEGHPWIFECKFDVHKEDFPQDFKSGISKT